MDDSGANLKLHPEHLADLRKSGLLDETIANAGIFSASPQQVREILGFNPTNSPGIAFPYPGTQDGNGRPYTRIKPDNPPIINGKPAKYLSLKGSQNRLYIPKGVMKVLQDPSIPLLITEGEKKCLKANQEGFPCISVAGVWCWKGKDSTGNRSVPIADLDMIQWKNQLVYIVFDSDLVEKEEVLQAEWALAEELTKSGAKVKVARLPDGTNGEKVGLDDYLLTHGKEALRVILNQAKEPQPPDMDKVQRLIDQNATIKEILEKIANLTSEVEKDRYLKKLSKARQVPILALRKDLKNITLGTSAESGPDPFSEYSQDEIEAAQRLLINPCLFAEVEKQIEAGGYVGEETNIRLLFLAFISRLLKEAISCVIKGWSAAGKNALVNAVLALLPKFVYKEFTAMSAQALYYCKNWDLSHKILVVFEAHGSEKADYTIRSSISEGKLRLLVTVKNPVTQSFESKEIEIPAEGLSYIETTTKSQLHDENQTRLFDLYIDTSEKQTREVLKAKARIINKIQVEKGNRIFQALQLLLKPYPVYIPFAEKLSETFPVKKIRVRRDFPRFLALIQASTLLHQYQRETTSIYSQEYLIANTEDYRIAYDIAQVVLAQTLKELTPTEERILKVIGEKIAIDKEFNVKDLVAALPEESEDTLRKYLKNLYKKGFLGWNEEKNKNSRYHLIKTMDSVLSLPSPEEIKNYDVNSGYTQIPESTQRQAGIEKYSGKTDLPEKYPNTRKSQDSGVDAITNDILSPEGILI